MFSGKNQTISRGSQKFYYAFIFQRDQGQFKNCSITSVEIFPARVVGDQCNDLAIARLNRKMNCAAKRPARSCFRKFCLSDCNFK